MTMKTLIILLLLALPSCSSKTQIDASMPVSQIEVVMCEGMSIIATNTVGTIKITAGKGFERFYTWDGDVRSQVLVPRKERWAGRFGILNGPGKKWKSHHSITDANLEEAQLHFKTLDEAIQFIRHDSRLDGETVYNDEGLVVTWSKAMHPYNKEEGSVLSVDVYQVLINEVKPSKLPGSQNDKIIVVQPCKEKKRGQVSF